MNISDIKIGGVYRVKPTLVIRRERLSVPRYLEPLSQTLVKVTEATSLGVVFFTQMCEFYRMNDISLFAKCIDEEHSAEEFRTSRVKKCCAHCGDYYEYGGDGETASYENANLCPSCRIRQFVLRDRNIYPQTIELPAEKGDDDDFKFSISIVFVRSTPIPNYAISTIVSTFNRMGTYAHIYQEYEIDQTLSIRTMSATLKTHLKHKDDFAEVFRLLKGYGGASCERFGAKLAISFDREYYNGEGDNSEHARVMRLNLLTGKIWDEAKKFGNRNDYIRSVQDDELTAYLVRSYDSTNGYMYDYYRHNIDLESVKYISYKIFSGSLNISVFFDMLNIMVNAVKIAKEKSVAEIENIGFENLLSETAKQYFEESYFALRRWGE